MSISSAETLSRMFGYGSGGIRNVKFVSAEMGGNGSQYAEGITDLLQGAAITETSARDRDLHRVR